MRSSRVITIFHQPPPSRRGPSAVMVSLVLHSAAFVWIYFGLSHIPKVNEDKPIRRYQVRVLRQDDLEYPKQRAVTAPAPRTAGQSGGHSAAHSLTQSLANLASSLPAPPALAPTRATPAPKFATALVPAPTSAAMSLPKPLPAPAPAPIPLPTPVAAPAPPPPPDLKQLLAKTRTLIQPDAPPDVKLQQVVPLPVIVKWSPDNSRDKLVVLPTPKEATAALAKPTLSPPNHEPKPADLKISSTLFKSKAPALPPSTTSPIVVVRAAPVTHVPETAAKAAVAPTPIQIVSLSDLQSKQAVIPIPAANSVARAAPSSTTASGHNENAQPAASPAVSAATAANGNASGKPTAAGTPSGKTTGTGNAPGNAAAAGNPSGKPNETGAGQSTAGDKAGKPPAGNAAVAKQDGNSSPGQTSPGPSSAGPSIPGPGQGNAGAGTSNINMPGPGLDPGAVRIEVAKDGHFGVVVVGSSLAEQYPETVSIWSGRLIYTVYLHVGPGKSWILQYSLPREGASVSAAATRPDAPWPFDMVRPHLEPNDFNSDAIMVHGFVNPAGRFERLGIVFPTEFAKSKLVLNALQQWQFRPARQNGQIAAVEVLLIIPEETTE